MTVTATPVTPLSRQYPHVENVADWRAQQSLRLLWDRVFAIEEALQALRATQGDLVSTANAHEDQLADLRVAVGEALAQGQFVSAAGGPGGGEGGGGGGGGESTIPNYGAIVHTALGKFVSPIVALDDGEEGKAQLCRQAAWDIYQIDDRIRLLEKTGGNNVAGMSTDIVLQGTDGSFADVSTYKNNGDGTVTIKATWGDHAPDSNTSNESRWIVPTEALALMDGPMERVV